MVAAFLFGFQVFDLETQVVEFLLGLQSPRGFREVLLALEQVHLLFEQRVLAVAGVEGGVPDRLLLGEDVGLLL